MFHMILEVGRKKKRRWRAGTMRISDLMKMKNSAILCIKNGFTKRYSRDQGYVCAPIRFNSLFLCVLLTVPYTISTLKNYTQTLKMVKSLCQNETGTFPKLLISGISFI